MAKGWLDKYDDGGKKHFLEPNDKKLPIGRKPVFNYELSSELAQSIGGENGEPAYLIPTFKYGAPLENPLEEYRNTGDILGGPFKTWQEADEWDINIRHPYVEKGQALPSPLKRWGKDYKNGGFLGTTNKGFNYNGAWGGQFRKGGEIMNVASLKNPIAQNGWLSKYAQDGEEIPSPFLKHEFRAPTQEDELIRKATIANKPNTPTPEEFRAQVASQYPQSGQADYFPLEALALPGTPAIKGIGKLANLAIDALNPVAGMRNIGSRIEERGIGAINPWYYKTDPELMYKSLNRNQAESMLKSGQIHKNVANESYGKYLPKYNDDGSVEYVFRNLPNVYTDAQYKPSIAFVKQDGKFNKISIDDVDKYDTKNVFILNKGLSKNDKKFVSYNQYLQSGKKYTSSPNVQFTKGKIENAYAPKIITKAPERIPADYILEANPNNVGFLKTKSGRIDNSFEPIAATGEKGLPSNVLENEYLSTNTPGVRMLKKDPFWGYKEIKDNDLNISRDPSDVATEYLNNLEESIYRKKYKIKNKLHDEFSLNNHGSWNELSNKYNIEPDAFRDISLPKILHRANLKINPIDETMDARWLNTLKYAVQNKWLNRYNYSYEGIDKYLDPETRELVKDFRVIPKGDISSTTKAALSRYIKGESGIINNQFDNQLGTKDIDFLNKVRTSISGDINDNVYPLGEVHSLTGDYLGPNVNVNNLKVGDKFEIPRFLSTYYKKYSSSGPVISNSPHKLNIQLNPESKGLVMDNYGLAYTPSENEILLNRNSGFKVKNINEIETMGGKKKREIDLEHLYRNGGSVPSSLNGTEMSYYKQGRDYKPKGMGKNGSLVSNHPQKYGEIELKQLTDFTNKPNKKWLSKYIDHE